MPPKEKSKKGGKALQAVAQLNAVLSTYKAACRRHGAPVNKQFVENIEECIQTGGALDKVSLSGPDQSSGCLKVMLDVMSGYPAVKNLACWNCAIGSEGLTAAAGFIRASGDKWWKGSKLRLVEVVSDGAGKSLDAWPTVCVAQMSGALEVKGSGHEQQSFLLDQGFTHVTPATLQLQTVGLQTPNAFQVRDVFNTLARVTGPVSSVMYHVVAETAERDQLVAALRQSAGVLDQPPAGGCAAKTPPAGKLTYHHLISQLDASSKSLASIATGDVSAQVDKAGQELGTVAEEEEQQEEEGEEEEQPALTEQPSEAPSTVPPIVSTMRSAAPSRLSIASEGMRQGALPDGRSLHTSGSIDRGADGDGSKDATDELAGTQAAEDAAYSSERPLYAVRSPGFLTGLDQPLTPGLRPMTFSPEALTHFSLALGSQGHGLKILILDHNQLGDLGMHHLASGLKRCATLQHLSLSGCGLGSVGAAALASTLVQDPDPLLASLQPKLLHLNVSNNPLGGKGLSALCDGLAACKTLKVVNLNSCGITDDDLQALTKFADTLSVNTSIENIDLDCNFFGDAGACVFFPLLSTTKHIIKLRITSRGMTRTGGGELTRLIRENLPAKKKAVGKKKKK